MISRSGRKDSSRHLDLLVLTEMWQFTALLQLILSNQPDKEELQLKFMSLLKNGRNLPSDFCMDILQKNLMFRQALIFLYNRGEFSFLLNYIKVNYQRSQTTLDTMVGELKEQNDQELTDAKQSTERLCSFWMENYVKFARKIN